MEEQSVSGHPSILAGSEPPVINQNSNDPEHDIPHVTRQGEDSGGSPSIDSSFPPGSSGSNPQLSGERAVQDSRIKFISQHRPTALPFTTVDRGRSLGPITNVGGRSAPVRSGVGLHSPPKTASMSAPSPLASNSRSKENKALGGESLVRRENSDKDNDESQGSDQETMLQSQTSAESGQSALRSQYESMTAANAVPSDKDKPRTTSKTFHMEIKPREQKVKRPRNHEAHISDEDEEESIRHAQSLFLHEGAVDNSKPHRTLQIIRRSLAPGAEIEADNNDRPSRTYCLASDLSEEAEYALKCTIGSILRDGDTLCVTYAIGNGQGIPIGSGAKVMKDAADIDKAAPVSLKVSFAKKLLKALPSKSSTPKSIDRAFSSPQLDRNHSIERLTRLCIGLLRKTPLQVKLVVEVVHCKDPRHCLLEVVSLSRSI